VELDDDILEDVSGGVDGTVNNNNNKASLDGTLA